ncbi:MAG TPA: zf-HC2 domain-containing protein [Anaerolineales bacterium]|nr:zf-HC2 domain-containing protein [Anaerolineales bacterium]
MPDHVTEWLNAYMDDELHGNRLRQVKEHLAECEACQAELSSLRDLSGLLRKVPTPDFTSPERFATQVNLLLPQKPVPSPKNSLLEIGWWMIPVGLLAVWAFVGTASIVSSLVSAASNIGLVDSANTLLISGTSDANHWTSTLRQLGLLEGNSLQWSEMTEGYSRNVIPQFVWQASIALLYLTWIAIWWARQTRQGYGQLLKS